MNRRLTFTRGIATLACALQPEVAIGWTAGTGISVCALAAFAVGQVGPPGPPVQQAYLKASNTDPLDEFGRAIALSGDTLLVGAPREDSAAAGVDGDQADNGLLNAGAAYVLSRTPSGWTQQAYLKSSSPGFYEFFGTAVGLSGETAVVGQPTGEVAGIGAGTVHVFVRSGATWIEQAVLTASNYGPYDLFGVAVAISGDTIVVGAREEDSAATGVNGDQSSNGADRSGAAYVFVRQGTTWTQQAYLKASNTNTWDEFGTSVAVDGDTIVVGTPFEASAATGVNGDQADNSAVRAGAAYVFVRSGTTWSQQAYLKASNTESSDQFAWSVAVTGDTVAVGASRESSSATGIDGDQVDNGAFQSGAAYVFVRSGTNWSQQAYVKASNTGVMDEFGCSVAAAGDLLLVGARGERSQACGVGGDEADDSAGGSGAAYLFRRTSGAWTPIAYLKPSFTQAAMKFGDAVALSGATCAIAAPEEDGRSTGVNGDQTSLGLVNENSGAAYAFDLDPGPWTDLTFGLAGSTGQPTLVGTGPLSAGSANALQLDAAPPFAPALLAVGTKQLGKFFKQGTFVPQPLAFLPLTTDIQGSLQLAFTWPAAIPAGRTFYVQAWIEDAGAPVGWSASNAVQGVSH